MNYFPGERTLTEAERRGFLYDEATEVLRQTLGRRAAAYAIRRVGALFVARPVTSEDSYYVYATSASSHYVGTWVENAGIRNGMVIRNPGPEDLPREEPPVERPVYVGDKVQHQKKGYTGTVIRLDITLGVVQLGNGVFKESSGWRALWTHMDGTPIADVRKNTSTSRPDGEEPAQVEARSAWSRLLDEDD